jgi:shikimate dehydrogenase
MNKSHNFLTPVTASFSQPAGENPTVAMMEAAYRHHGLPHRYINLEVSPGKLEDAVQGARAMGFVGFNCSLPHKVAVIEHLDGLGESAELMGAVNCVVRREGKLVGENTDGKGFVKSLETLTSPKDKNIVLLGAGGAARAIGVELALAGAERITLINRTEERGLELAKLLRDKAKIKTDFDIWQDDFEIPSGTDVVINATSIGLSPDVKACPKLKLDSLKPGMIVADVIPNPPQTVLLREAAERGCKILDGLGMLVNQGVLGIKYWTDVDADPAVMRQALEKVFGEE